MSRQIQELDNIKTRAQALRGSDQTQSVLDLDSTVAALRDIKTNLEKFDESLYTNTADIVMPVRDTKLPKYKGDLPKRGTIIM